MGTYIRSSGQFLGRMLVVTGLGYSRMTWISDSTPSHALPLDHSEDETSLSSQRSRMSSQEKIGCWWSRRRYCRRIRAGRWL